MNRRIALFACVPLGALALGGGSYLVRGALSGAAVPTLRVAPLDFVIKVRAEGVLKAAESTSINSPVSAGTSMTLAWIIQDGTTVRQGDVLFRFDPSDFEKKLLDGQADVASAQARIAKARAESRSAADNLARDAEMAKAEREYAQKYKSTDERIFSRSEIADSQIDTALAEEQERYARDMIGVKGAMARTEVDLHAIQEKKSGTDVTRARQALDAVEIRAPHDGVVVLRRNWQGNLPRVGETVWPGMKLAEIPKTKRPDAEIYVLEADAGGLAQGQRAEVVALGGEGRPIRAKVVRVDALAQPRFPEVPVQYFGATLKLEGAVPESLVPGQRVRAEIVLQNLSQVLVLPRQAIFQIDGKSVVYRRRLAGGFSAVPVVLGAGAPGRVVVKEGIEAGDTVALLDPKEGEVEKKAPRPSGPPVGGAP